MKLLFTNKCGKVVLNEKTVSMFALAFLHVYGLSFVAGNSRYVSALLFILPVLKVVWSTHVWLLS